MGANSPDVRMSQRAAEEWSVLTLSELFACGLSSRQVEVRVRRGTLHPLHGGVFAVGHPNVPLEGRFLAAVKACGPGALLSHFSAGVLWEFLEWDQRFPEVTVVGASTRERPGLRVHRTSILSPADVRVHKKIPVTSPARTIIDLGASFTEHALRRVVRRAWGSGELSPTQLIKALDRHEGRRGMRKLRRILADAAPTRSELENLVLDLMLGAGMKGPDVNRPLRLDGRRVTPDFRWPAQRLVVEADSAAWHEDPIARAEDRERQALLEAHGERVVRVTWRQAVAERRRTVQRILEAGAPRE
jgi:very-short-patch-repair endonuclease